MRIALVVPGGFDASGEERVIPALLALTERLSRRHEVRVLVLSGTRRGRHELAGASVEVLGGGVRLLGRAAQLRRALHRRADVVHAFWVGECGAPAALAARSLGLPCLVSVGGGELVSLPGISFGGMRPAAGRLRAALALRLAAAVTGGSRHALVPVLHPRTRCVPLGVDADRFAPDAGKASGPPFRLVNVASLNRVKGPEILLAALARVAGGADVHLDWIGEDTLSGVIQRRARALGIANRVTFHGFVPNAALPALLGRAHLNVQASHHESQGVAVLEAAAAGVPTVGTATGLVADMAPGAALAVPVGDAPALAAGIRELLADGARRERLGRGARAFALRHDADATARRFEELYLEVRAS